MTEKLLTGTLSLNTTNQPNLRVIAAKKSLQLGEVEYSTSIEFISASITAGRNDIGN